MKRSAELITCGWWAFFVGGKEGGSMVGWRCKSAFVGMLKSGLCEEIL